LSIKYTWKNDRLKYLIFVTGTSRVVSGTGQKNSTSPFLSWKSKKATKGLTPDIDWLTTWRVCSIPHSQVILVKRGSLGGISEIPLLLLRESRVVCIYRYMELKLLFIFPVAISNHGTKIKFMCTVRSMFVSAKPEIFKVSIAGLM
jgi:hypothetical protein